MTEYSKLVEALRYCEFGWSAQTCDNCEYSKTDCQIMLSDAADAIEALQAELPKRGKWVRVEDGESYHYECSECGERPLYSRYEDVVLSGVCPLCGAKMEVQDGE